MSPRPRRKKDPEPKATIENAYVRYARNYSQLAEAMMREGVEESVARETAQLAATTVLMHETFGDLSTPRPCPVCGHVS